MHGFPHGYASGWYQVGWSDQFASGDVVPLRYFATDLVCYRNESGVLHISDAFCPHFGAHLGDRKSTRLNSSHIQKSRMPSSA